VKLRYLAFAVAFVAIVSTCAPFAHADTPPTAVQTGTISGTGLLPELNVPGDNTCQLQFTGTGTATVTAQGASDYVRTYNAITSATAVGAAGTLTFSISTALLAIRLNITVYSGTAIPYTLTCSGSTGSLTSGGTPITPTATPSAAPAGLPVVAYDQAQCGTSGLYCPLSSSGSAATGSARNSLNIDVCVPAATTCVVPTAGPADAAPTQISMQTISFGMGYNGTTYDRLRTAASPAPTGVLANGYNTAGTAAPIICTKPFGGSGTTDGNVQIVALSGTTHVYVCSVTISVGGTVAGDVRLLSGTGSACATPVNNGPGTEFATSGVATVNIGDGLGMVFDGGAGNELCIGGTGTSTLYIYSGMYEQF
jgi:hypothetical protein